ncbi:MAG: methyltransferase domain-containing protein [Vicinamibacterales bacterium]
MRFLRGGPPPFQTALAMIGAKPGQTVVLAGAGDGRLAAQLAQVTGLNGRTLVVDAPDATARAEVVATAAGALIEPAPGRPDALPVDAGMADVVVLHQVVGAPGVDTAAVAAEALRALRPGGRAVAIGGTPPAGLVASLTRSGRGAPGVTFDPDRLREAFTIAGFRAARLLAEAEGVTYVEGVRARDASPDA